jgi:hypothetical protein
MNDNFYPTKLYARFALEFAYNQKEVSSVLGVVLRSENFSP